MNISKQPNLQNEARKFCEDIYGWYGNSQTRVHTQPNAEREALHLAALQHHHRNLAFAEFLI